MAETTTFRLHLSSSGITDASVAGAIRRAHDQVLRAFRATPQGAAAATAALGRELRVGDVPIAELTLNHNALTDAALPHVADFVRAARVPSLELLGNAITDGGAAVLATLLRDCGGALRRLKLGDNALTAKGARALAEAVDAAKPSALVQLQLSGNQIGDDGVVSIAATAACTAGEGGLEVLGLRDVGMISARGWGAVGAMLAAPTSRVCELNLSSNAAADDDVIEVFAAAALNADDGSRSSSSNLPPCPLRTLSVSGCNISSRGAAAFFTAVARFAFLCELDISNNALGDEGVRHLLTLLGGGEARSSGPAELTVLSLSNTNITESTVAAIASCAPLVRHLTSLDLSFNGVGGEAVTPSSARPSSAPLVQLISGATKLRSLNLRRCLLPTALVGDICAAVAAHAALSDIDFSSNFSRDENAAAWADLVRTSTHLRLLQLTDNEMGAASVDAVVGALRDSDRRNVAKLKIGGQSTTPPLANVVPAATQVALTDALRRNSQARNAAAGAAHLIDGRSARINSKETPATVAAAATAATGVRTPPSNVSPVTSSPPWTPSSTASSTPSLTARAEEPTYATRRAPSLAFAPRQLQPQPSYTASMWSPLAHPNSNGGAAVLPPPFSSLPPPQQLMHVPQRQPSTSNQQQQQQPQQQRIATMPVLQPPTAPFALQQHHSLPVVDTSGSVGPLVWIMPSFSPQPPVGPVVGANSGLGAFPLMTQPLYVVVSPHQQQHQTVPLFVPVM